MPANVWFTADAHFGHAKVAALRGFDDPAEHDEHLLETFNDVVRPGDHVWWLGDMSGGSHNPVFAAMRRLRGVHHLVPGNHDRCHPMYRDAHKWLARFGEHFVSVQAFARRRVQGVDVMLSHFPYATSPGADHTAEVRWHQYRLPDTGGWLVHGHTHDAGQRIHGRQLHVGLDAWGLRPVNLDEVASAIGATS